MKMLRSVMVALLICCLAPLALGAPLASPEYEEGTLWPHLVQEIGQLFEATVDFLIPDPEPQSNSESDTDEEPTPELWPTLEPVG